MMEKTLIEQIQDTQTLLETLSAEQSDLGVKMSLAASDADSASLISLAHRRNNLPIEILSEQIRLEQLLLQRDEERLPQLQSEVAKLAEPIPAMQKQIADLQVQFNIASGAVTNANEDVRQTRLEIAERRRAIEALLAQARNVKIAPASLAMNGGR
jgi:predicted  nucleic acid-binding Zn-ribbon protein